MERPIKNLKPDAWLLAALFFFTTLFGGWIAEDALIPLRVVDQYWAGNGLVWNPGERVQVCTSLLWQLLILPLGIFPNTPMALLLFNCSLSGVFGLLLGQYTRSPWVSAIIACIWLASWSTRDFMSCGLETPLVALLLFNLATQVNKDPRSAASAWAIGLLPLGRPDLALLCLPFAPLNAWSKQGNWLRMAMPLGVQGLLAGWYFGSPLPNTFYAKLTAHIEPEKILEAGLDYLDLSLKSDLALGIAPLLGVAALFWSKKPYLAWCIAIGTTLYFAYSVKSADYMLGRFIVPTLLLSLCVLAFCQIPKALAIGAMAVILPLAWINTKTGKEGIHIVDEKRTHFGALTRDLLTPRFYNQHGSSITGRKTHCDQTISAGCVGAQGLESPLETTIIDGNRITNPLLSRLPATFHKGFSPGHLGTDSYPYSEYFLTGNTESIKSTEIQKLAKLLKSAHEESIWKIPRLKNITELFFFRLSNKEKFRLRYPNHQTGEPGKEFRIGGTGTVLPLNPNDKIMWVGISAAAWGKFFNDSYKCIGTELMEHTKITKIPEGTKFVLILPTEKTPDNATATIWIGTLFQYKSAVDLFGETMNLDPKHIDGVIEPFRNIPPTGLLLPLKAGEYLIKIQPTDAAIIESGEKNNGWIKIIHRGEALKLLPGKNPRLNGILILYTRPIAIR